MSAVKRDQKRHQPIGTRRLTERALRQAFNVGRRVSTTSKLAAWYDPKEDWLFGHMTERKWRTLVVMLRVIEHHVILHQQRQVATDLRRFADSKKAPAAEWIRVAASHLAAHWTIPNEAERRRKGLQVGGNP